jgi:hypothetical protein
MRYLFILGLVALPLSFSLFGQSLFDKALELNRVYNTIDSLYQAGETVGTGDKGSPPELFFPGVEGNLRWRNDLVRCRYTRGF